MEQQRCVNPGCRALLVPGSDYCTNCGTGQLPTTQMISDTGDRQPRGWATRMGLGVALGAGAALGVWGFVTVTGDGNVDASAGSAESSRSESTSSGPVESEAATVQSGSQDGAEDAAEPTPEPPPEQSSGPDPDWTMYPVSAYTQVSVRVAPNRDARKLGRIKRGELVHIVCLTKGEPVVDHRGDTIRNWDWIDYPITGYVPDAFINTGGSPPPVPTC